MDWHMFLLPDNSHMNSRQQQAETIHNLFPKTYIGFDKKVYTFFMQCQKKQRTKDSGTLPCLIGTIQSSFLIQPH